MAVNKDEAVFIPTPPQFIAGMQFDYGWNEPDVKEFIEHYIELKESGANDIETISTLTRVFKRHAPEVAILIMDLAERGYISPKGRGSNPRAFAVTKVREKSKEQKAFERHERYITSLEKQGKKTGRNKKHHGI
jgi:hypothetical protein